MRVTTINLLLLTAAAIIGSASFSNAERIRVPLINPGPKAAFEISSASPRLRQAAAHFASASPNPQDVAVKFVRQHLGVIKDGFSVKNSYHSEALGLTHFYFRQIVKGTEVTNGDIAVHVDNAGRIVAYSDNFYRSDDVTKQKLWNGESSNTFVRPREAFKTFAAYIKQSVDIDNIKEVALPSTQDQKPKFELQGVPSTRKPVVVQQSYVHTKDGHLVPTWEFFAYLEYNYFHAHVSANGKDLLSLSDWVSPASYTVIKIGDENIDVNNRTLVTDPEDKVASPKGWHDFSGVQTNTTRGNNVEVMIPVESTEEATQFMPQSADGNFNYPVDLSKDPSTNHLFYATNIAHDFFYRYGFNEAAGNFQKDNYGKGGQGNDQLLAYAQDPTDMNNSDFLTPPDGEEPTMRMYIWDHTNPHRDGALENDIVIHEYSHGVSTRLTGGPANSDCLYDSEAGGWGDFFAIWLRLKSTDKNTMLNTLGNYVHGKNIREYPYATDMTANPTMYDYLNKEDWQQYHKIGVVWGNISIKLDKLGFTDDKHSADITKGVNAKSEGFGPVTQDTTLPNDCTPTSK
ncbi:Fungalysin metallopeptidase-domain-containing protein [Syncephalis plumigaleata]|nr:Fungalysin metallopeptidase-domain-containing protein [Syncephalis plumigaleata]